MEDAAKPQADAETQTAPSAKSGGTYGKRDISKSAQRSRAHEIRSGDESIADIPARGDTPKPGGAS